VVLYQNPLQSITSEGWDDEEPTDFESLWENPHRWGYLERQFANLFIFRNPRRNRIQEESEMEDDGYGKCEVCNL